MKVLLKLLVFLLSMLALVLVVALFVDGNYSVKREGKVVTPPQTTFNYLKNLKNQEHYVPFFKQDPNIKIWYEGTQGHVGSKICWSSKKTSIGRGEFEITELINNKKIVLQHRQFSPSSEENVLNITLEPVGQKSTQIRFEITGKVSYPWNLQLLFDDKNKKYGTDFDQRLKNIAILLKQEEVITGIESY